MAGEYRNPNQFERTISLSNGNVVKEVGGFSKSTFDDATRFSMEQRYAVGPTWISRNISRHIERNPNDPDAAVTQTRTGINYLTSAGQQFAHVSSVDGSTFLFVRRPDAYVGVGTMITSLVGAVYTNNRLSEISLQATPYSLPESPRFHRVEDALSALRYEIEGKTPMKRLSDAEKNEHYQEQIGWTGLNPQSVRDRAIIEFAEKEAAKVISDLAERIYPDEPVKQKNAQRYFEEEQLQQIELSLIFMQAISDIEREEGRLMEPAEAFALLGEQEREEILLSDINSMFSLIASEREKPPRFVVHCAPHAGGVSYETAHAEYIGDERNHIVARGAVGYDESIQAGTHIFTLIPSEDNKHLTVTCAVPKNGFSIPMWKIEVPLSVQVDAIEKIAEDRDGDFAQVAEMLPVSITLPGEEKISVPPQY